MKKRLPVILIVGLGIAGGVWYFLHTSTPEYRAELLLAEAEGFVNSGQLRNVAQTYMKVIKGKSQRANDAAVRFYSLMKGPVKDASLGEASAVLRFGVTLEEKGHGVGVLPIAQTLIEKHELTDTKGTLALLDVIAPLAEKCPFDIDAKRAELLNRLENSKDPDPKVPERPVDPD